MQMPNKENKDKDNSNFDMSALTNSLHEIIIDDSKMSLPKKKQKRKISQEEFDNNKILEALENKCLITRSMSKKLKSIDTDNYMIKS